MEETISSYIVARGQTIFVGIVIVSVQLQIVIKIIFNLSLYREVEDYFLLLNTSTLQ